MIKIAVSGCRNYNNYEELKEKMNDFINGIDKDEIVILSGHCKGTDMLAEKYAEENNYKTEIYKAEWSKYGRAAGPIRNEKMIFAADMAICFWNGESKGTKSFIEAAKKHKKTIKVCMINISNPLLQK